MFEALTVGRLRAQYAWLEPLAGGRAPGAAVDCCVSIFTIAAAALCAHNHFLAEHVAFWALLPDIVLSFIIIACKCLLLLYTLISCFCLLKKLLVLGRDGGPIST